MVRNIAFCGIGMYTIYVHNIDINKSKSRIILSQWKFFFSSAAF